VTGDFPYTTVGRHGEVYDDTLLSSTIYYSYKMSTATSVVCPECRPMHILRSFIMSWHTKPEISTWLQSNVDVIQDIGLYVIA